VKAALANSPEMFLYGSAYLKHRKREGTGTQD
jgi:hypothetical protein